MPALKPIQLPGLTIETPIALGPMAGVTDLPFRTLALEQGCGMFYTEMVSAKALHYGNQNTFGLMHTGEKEHPVGLQIFGSDPEILAEEAYKVQDRFDFIDFNMGCPVPKIVKNHEGSYLLTQPVLVREIFTAICRKVEKPVTVKMRYSFSGNLQEGIEIAKILEDCGVSLLAVHGRTREQYYSGKADRSTIRAIKEAVSIPVLGNGDIFSAQDAAAMIEETGCDGVMVARGAEGNPWLFRDIRTYLETGIVPERPDMATIIATILRHAKMLEEEKGSHLALMEMRKHTAWYLQGQKGAVQARRRLNEVTTFEELESLLHATFPSKV